MRQWLCAGLLSLLFAVLSSTCPLAQSAPKSEGSAAVNEWIVVTITRVKPEMLQEWQDLIKNEVNPAYQKANVPWRNTWATALFGDTYEYVTVGPITKFAQFDQPAPLVRALGQESATRLGHKLRKCIDGSRTYAVRLRPELSIMGDPNIAPKLAIVTSVRTFPGKGPQWENFLKTEILPHYKKMNLPGYLVHQTVFGGDPNEYVILTLRNNLAELDKGPLLAQAVGAETAQQILARGGPFVASVDTRISRFVPELSFPAAPAVK